MRSRGSRRSARFLAVLAAGGLLLAACGSEAADRDAFVRAMTEQAQLTDAEAACVADEIFVNSGLSEAEINEGSDDLNGPASTAFRTAFEAAVELCTDL